MAKRRKIFDVVGAFIKDGHNRVLLCKRMENDRFGSMWEFPGGKIEMHEEKRTALKREIKEELGVDIKVGRLINRFDDEIPEMKIYVYLFNCSIVNGKPECKDCQDLRWITLDQAKELNLAPADKKIVQYLKRRRIR